MTQDDKDKVLKWEDIIPKNWTLGEMPDMMKSNHKQVVPEFPKRDYYMWNFNHKTGDVVRFADGGFDEYNNSFMYGTLNLELATSQGVVTDVYSDMSAYSNGSFWVCKVDFDGKIIETCCGFFDKV